MESRTTTASAFADARYPGAVANDLDHSETFAYDPRFGVPHSVTDANGRTTSRKLDPFGRVVELTNADRVKFTTAYSRCGPGDCAAVDGMAPAMKVEVETSPKVAPKVTRYLDRLGRRRARGAALHGRALRGGGAGLRLVHQRVGARVAGPITLPELLKIRDPWR